jgi:hypothetical protein
MSVAAELKDIRETLSYIVQHMATKEDLFALQTQVNSIEKDIREMKKDKLPARMTDVEEKLFGKPRS